MNDKSNDENEEPTEVWEIIVNVLFTVGLMSVAIIFALAPAYIFMFLWNRWLAKFLGSQPVTDITQVYSLLFCVTVAISIVNSLSSSKEGTK